MTKDNLVPHLVFIIIFLIVALVMVMILSSPQHIDDSIKRSYDDGWHNGIKTCQEQMNLTSEEIKIINEIRINKIIKRYNNGN